MIPNHCKHSTKRRFFNRIKRILNVIFTLKTHDAPPDRDRTAGISKRYRNLELSDGRIVLRSFDLDNPSGMKGQMPRIEGEIQPVAIGIRGKNRVQILAERGDLFPVSADNVSDCITSFQNGGIFRITKP